MPNRFTGPAYPFGPDPDGTFGPKPDLQVIFSSIVNILTTPVKTYPPIPDLGSFLPYLIFDIEDEVTAQLVRYYTGKDLTDQEDRIIVTQVLTEIDPDNQTIYVNVGFQVVGDPTGQVYFAPVIFPREG
jgi:phage baseplate assembly protein W